MKCVSIPSVAGSLKRRKRVGRGIGSGHGKTSTRGQKGQRARTGSRKRPGFEGSRTPLIRRLPKRGFKDKSTGRTAIREIINVGQLNRFADDERITPERLEQEGLIHHAAHEIKLLGEGTLSRRLAVAIHSASQGATLKVQQAGGSIELMTTPGPKHQGPSGEQAIAPSDRR